MKLTRKMKQRLIDANRLLNPGYTDMFDEPIQFVSFSRAAIENAPTVEAIPVEWLKKWAKDNSNGEWSTEYRTVFNGILKDWEKEKER